jgi:hypothetical protein
MSSNLIQALSFLTLIPNGRNIRILDDELNFKHVSWIKRLTISTHPNLYRFLD